MFIPGAALQDGHWNSRKSNGDAQVFQQGREFKKTDSSFVAKEEADKKEHATPETLRSGKKLDAKDVRMEQKAGGREDKVFTMALHTISL